MVVQQITFTDEEWAQLQNIAKRRGFSKVATYLRYLVDVDAVDHDESLVFDDDADDEDIREGIKQGLREALRGEGISIEEFWQEIEADSKRHEALIRLLATYRNER